VLAGTLFALSGVAFGGAAPPGDPWAAIIEVNEPREALKPLLGVNRPPLVDGRWAPFYRYDYAALYRSFGVQSVRVHDAGADLCAIYLDDELLDLSVTPSQSLTECVNIPSGGAPHVLWRVRDPAQVDNPDHYDFERTDQLLASVAALPAKIYFRLGETYNGPNDTDDPPAWAAVARNVYRHLIGQFKSDPALSIDLEAVEIHNEPDGFFWVGSNANFFDLYRRTTDHLRTEAALHGRTHPVGGPGFTQAVVEKMLAPFSLTGQFIGEVGGERLDYFSAHYYGTCSPTTQADLRNWLRTLRGLIDARGLAAKPLYISEWNIGLGQLCGSAFYRDPRLASFTAAALTMMHESEFNVGAAHFYSGAPIMSLFGHSETLNNFEIQPAAWAFWAHRQLAGGTRVNVQHCQSGSCGTLADSPEVPAVLAVNREGRVLAVLANDTASSKTLRLRWTGLSGAPPATARLWQPPASTVHTLQGLLSDDQVAVDSAGLSALLDAIVPSTVALTALGGDAVEAELSLAANAVLLLEVDLRQVFADGFEDR
jgi:hypothetical protein